MNKVKRSGRLLRASFGVLCREKRLLLFPLIAAIAIAMIAAFFIAPVVLQDTGHGYGTTEHWTALVHSLPGRGQAGDLSAARPHWWIQPLFATAYFACMVLATFCNVAFYHEIMRALAGDAVSLARGFRFATTRWKAVLLWSLLAGLVGYLISAIQERVGFVGKLVTSLIGVAWSVACIFIVPTTIREKETADPLKLLRSSAGTLKRTWGELIIGFVGVELAFGFVITLLIVLALLTGGVGTTWLCFHFNLNFWWVGAVVLGEVLLVAVPLGLAGSVLNPVYRCALYTYATEGVVPEPFDLELLDSAWKVK